jgi:hypothetical protein
MANAEVIEKKSFSFKRGWDKLQKKDVKIVREEIIKVLKLEHRQNFYPRLYGSVEPKISEYEAIEAIFAKYGVTDVWGEN